MTRKRDRTPETAGIHIQTNGMTRPPGIQDNIGANGRKILTGVIGKLFGEETAEGIKRRMEDDA